MKKIKFTSFKIYIIFFCRLQLERSERQAKIEASRLNAEITSLRQRLDRADADLLQSKRENLRLMDEVASLEKEVRRFMPSQNKGH